MTLNSKLSKAWLPILIFLSGLYIHAEERTKSLVIIDLLASGNFKDSPEGVSGHKIIMLRGEADQVTKIATDLSKISYYQIHVHSFAKPGSLIFDEIKIIPDNLKEYAATSKAGEKISTPVAVYSIPEAFFCHFPGLSDSDKSGEYAGCKYLS
jgi:hypothetical protein